MKTTIAVIAALGPPQPLGGEDLFGQSLCKLVLFRLLGPPGVRCCVLLSLLLFGFLVLPPSSKLLLYFASVIDPYFACEI